MPNDDDHDDEQGLTSHSIQFRSFRRWCFYRPVRWPN